MLIQSAMISAGSGSIGGITMGHARGGMYIRRRAIPVNSNTPRQQNVRAAMGQLVVGWNNILSESQREAWDLFASQTPTTNALGQVLQLTGQQSYIGLNTPRLQAKNVWGDAINTPVVNAAPTEFNGGVTPQAVTNLEIAADTLSGQIVFGGAAPEAGFALVYVGRPINDGRVYYGGPFQLAFYSSFMSEAASATINADMTDSAEWALDGPLVVGQRRPWRIRLTFADGRLSQEWRGMVTPDAGT